MPGHSHASSQQWWSNDTDDPQPSRSASKHDLYNEIGIPYRFPSSDQCFCFVR